MKHKKPETMTELVARRILVGYEDLQLSSQQLRFVASYVTNGFNAQRAAQSAGYKMTTAIASQVLKNPNVVIAVKKFVDVIMEPYKARLEFQVMEIYYRRATFDVNTFFDSNGKPRSLDTISHEWMCCIDGVKESYAGSNASRRIVDYKLADRDIALQTLLKFVTRFAESEVDPDLPTEARDRLNNIFNAALGRNGLGIKRRIEQHIEYAEAMASDDDDVKRAAIPAAKIKLPAKGRKAKAHA